MLVLTRKRGETIHIGDGVVVTVVRIGGGQVRLGITAARDVEVVRGELLITSGADALTSDAGHGR